MCHFLNYQHYKQNILNRWYYFETEHIFGRKSPHSPVQIFGVKDLRLLIMQQQDFGTVTAAQEVVAERQL